MIPSPCPTMEDRILFEALRRLVGREDTQSIQKQRSFLYDVL